MNKKNLTISKHIIVILACATTQLSFATASPLLQTYDASKIEREISQPTDLQNVMDEINHFIDEDSRHYVHGIVQADKQSIMLKSVIIENNTIFSDNELAFAYHGKLNKNLKFTDLVEITQRITKRYQQAGYMLSFAIIPKQQIVDGVLTVIVVEGMIDKVDVLDKSVSEYSNRLSDYVQLLLQTKPMTRDVYSNFITKTNLLPGVEIQPVLTPSKSNFGASTLVLNIKETPVDAAIYHTNHVSSYYGSIVNSKQLTYNDIKHSFQTSIGCTRSSFSHHRKLAANNLLYRHFVGDNGTTISLDYSNGVTKPYFNSDVDNFQFQGRNKKIGFLVDYPLWQTFYRTVAINIGMQFKKNDTSILNAINTMDRERVLQIGGEYKDNSSVFNRIGSSKVQIDVYQGIKGLGATAASNINISRLGGKTNFTKINLTAARLQSITPHIYLSLLLEGQYAFVPLLSLEEYSFGGNKLGRGYSSTIISGDNALASKLEFIYERSIANLATSQIFVAYDIGKMWNKLPVLLNEPKGRISAASAATGIRFKFMQHLDMELSVAKPLTHLSINNDKATRFFVTVDAHL